MDLFEFLDRVFTHHTHGVNAKLDGLTAAIYRLETKIMGLKEDFSVFVATVNERTNQIGAALDDIALDLAALKGNPETPAEVAASMTEITTKLAVLSETSKAIADANQPVVPPPIA